VREYWAIYRALAGAYIRSRLQYRLSFWLGVLTTVSVDLVPLLLLGIIFTRFPSVHGWGWRDIALLYGLDQLSFGLSRCFSRQIDNFDNYIVTGDFDSFLVRPLPPLFHLLASRFEITELGRLCGGVVVLTVAARAAGVPFTAGNVAIALAAAVGGAMLLFSFLLMVATVSFWHTRSG
jgi:ABC-2 type transport system permease protein